MPTKVAIAGATGYAGGELARLVLRHPEARLRRAEGFALVRPGDDAEVVFTALPAGEAAKQAGAWLGEGRTVIDIGSDFRLRDPALYQNWYGYAHPGPELLKEA